LVLRQHEGWLDALVLVSVEALRRCEAVARTQRAERSLAAREMQATLGRYMLDTRHAMNNALTSVLGNAELLLLDTRLSDTVTSQVETIRNMALRMHEILQRFSSLEKELTVVEKQTENDSRARSRAVAG
jgi:signal transduction histidine kinase